MHNITRILNNQFPEKLLSIVPDATSTLIKATTEQDYIGWDQWINEKWSREWGTLINYDINNTDSGKSTIQPKNWLQQ
jgi:hypothetical protein